MNRHDTMRPQCPKMELVILGKHSNGISYYYCRNCKYAGPEGFFKGDFDYSKLVLQILEERNQRKPKRA